MISHIQMARRLNQIGIQSHSVVTLSHKDVLCYKCVDVCLSEATERREAALERQTSPSQLPTALLTLEGMTSYRRIEEAFHCKLKGPVVVDEKTLVELQNFQTVCLWTGTVLVSEHGLKNVWLLCLTLCLRPVCRVSLLHLKSGKAFIATLRRKLALGVKKKKLTFSILHIIFWAAYKRHSVSDLE